jgi:hypothetical protein
LTPQPRFKLGPRDADEMEDRSARVLRSAPDSTRKEVREMKKLILRVLFSSAALAAVVFIMGAPAKHPK